MIENPVRWFEIYVQDAKRAKDFYEKVLGISLEKLDEYMGAGIDEMWMFPAGQGRPGATGALVKMQGVPSGGNRR